MVYICPSKFLWKNLRLKYLPNLQNYCPFQLSCRDYSRYLHCLKTIGSSCYFPLSLYHPSKHTNLSLIELLSLRQIFSFFTYFLLLPIKYCSFFMLFSPIRLLALILFLFFLLANLLDNAFCYPCHAQITWMASNAGVFKQALRFILVLIPKI